MSPKFKLLRDGKKRDRQSVPLPATARPPCAIVGARFVEGRASGRKNRHRGTIIHDEASVKNFSAQVIEAPRAFAERTSISGGIDFAVAQLARSPYDAARRTIDISGDGNNNAGRNVAVARDEALAKA